MIQKQEANDAQYPRLQPGQLATLRFRRWIIPIIPAWSVVYLFVALLIIFAGALTLDRKVMPGLERDRMIPSKSWQYETDRINLHIREKKIDGRVWRSTGHPVSEIKSKSKRILVLGDSFAWGAALANINDVWWLQLQRELAWRGYNDVEVIASAAAGASTRKQLEFARAVVPAYQPDLIIWGYVTNDPDENLVRSIDLSRVRQRLLGEKTHTAIVSLIEDTLPYIAYRLNELRFQKLQHLLSGPDYGYEYSNWELRLLKGENLARYRATLADVKRFHDETGIPGYFMTLPNHPSPQRFAPRHAGVAPLFSEAGIPFHDILDEFTRAWGGLPLLRYAATPNDGHPGPISTRFFALQAANILESQYNGVLGARTKSPAATFHVNDWNPANLAVRHDVGRRTISFWYPMSSENMLRMPFGRPYVQLNLELPLPIRAVRVQGSYLQSAAISYTEVATSTGFDNLQVRSLPPQRGDDLKWVLPQRAGSLINTLRLEGVFRKVEDVGSRKIVRLREPFTRADRHAWSAFLPDTDRLGDEGGRRRTVLRLLENGRPLATSSSEESDVSTRGGGRFAQRPAGVLFSTSDNSNPRRNGRRYEVEILDVPSDWRTVTIEVLE